MANYCKKIGFFLLISWRYKITYLYYESWIFARRSLRSERTSCRR